MQADKKVLEAGKLVHCHHGKGIQTKSTILRTQMGISDCLSCQLTELSAGSLKDVLRLYFCSQHRSAWVCEDQLLRQLLPDMARADPRFLRLHINGDQHHVLLHAQDAAADSPHGPGQALSRLRGRHNLVGYSAS